VSLGIASPAPLDVLIHHLKELALLMDVKETKTLQRYIIHSLRKIAAYLKHHKNQSKTQALMDLSTTPLVVLDNGDRVTCDHVCVDIEEDVDENARAMPEVYIEVSNSPFMLILILILIFILI